MTRRALHRDRAGATAAEFALVLPILTFFLLGIVDAGRFIWQYNQIEKATQVGVRTAAVTSMIPSGLAAHSFVGDTVGGTVLTQGDPVPASALGTTVCSRSGTTMTCTCSCGGLTLTPYATSGYDVVLARMQSLYPDLTDANVNIVYRGSGVGYAGDPNGSDIAPLVSVQIHGLDFTPITTLLLATFNMPTLSSSLTAEDSSGTDSN